MSDRRIFLLLLAVLTVLLFVEMPGSWLLEPDEARYAEIPREMLATGNWLVPKLNGVDYFEKPPLTYWAGAVSIALLGHDPFAARLPERLAIVGTALLLAGALRKRFGERVAALAALIFLSSPLVFACGRTALTDGVLTFAMTITLLALDRFLVAAEKGEPAGGAAALTGLGCGLALLDKGLIGVVLPGGAFLLWCLLRRTARPIGTILFSWAPVVCIAVAAPYFIAVERAAPGFSKFFWIHEHFARYATAEASRPGPAWYFVVTFLLGMLPWTLFSSRLGRRLWWSRRRATVPDASDLWYALWFSVILVFFSLSHSKLVPYFLPACPAAAVLFARLIDADLESGARTPARPLAFHALFWTVAAPAAFLLLASGGDLARYGLTALAAAALAVLVVASWGGAAVAKTRPAAGISVAVGGWCIFYAALIAAFPSVTPDQSAHDLATAAGRAAGDSGEVVCYRTYLQGFPWDLERRVRIFGWKGELAFGSARGDQSAWFPPAAAFFPDWDSGRKMVALVRKRDRPDLYGHRAELVAQNRKYIVVKNF
ncbi:MAG TPA: phospholipid carrier-dependent glycosyltransferase [Thermoanaerobaculia bacterium]|nr:phospholipid carrier-dependent glycosyltransferase [Thermoanaerobaculia bacterium]